MYISNSHILPRYGIVVSVSTPHAVGHGFAPQPRHTKDHYNKSAILALCHPPSASLFSVLAGQYSSPIFTHDKYNILNDILIEFEFKHYY